MTNTRTHTEVMRDERPAENLNDGELLHRVRVVERMLEFGIGEPFELMETLIVDQREVIRRLGEN